MIGNEMVYRSPIQGVRIGERRDPHLLYVGELITPDAGRTVWKVERVSDLSADVRCVIGRKPGEMSTWSARSTVERISAEVVEARIAARVVERVVDKDETRCPNCWAPEPGVVDGVDRGRDYHCRDHQVEVVAPIKPQKGVVPPQFLGRKREGFTPTAEAIEMVKAMKAEGKPYAEMDRAMGWPSKTGSRSYKILSDLGLTGKGKRK
jgi:hypothetical protein